MKLLDLYTSLLKTGSMVATDDGFISYKVGNDTKPTLIKGKRLVLPTAENLKDNTKKELIVFHPLSENILRGESVVLEEFRSAINIKLNLTIGELANELLLIATSVAVHSKLNPDQLEFLSKLKNADEKTLDAFNKIIKAMSQDSKQNSFVHIYLKRSGVVNGKKHSRAGIVNFPFYTELTKTGNDVYGVKLRNKDKETFINLMEYIFPTISTNESYNRGSNSDVAPYLDALMKAVMAVASPLNDQIILFSNMISDHEDMLIEDGWVETFDNLGVMIPEIRMIPMQAGNEGTSVTAPTQEAQQAAPVQAQKSAQMYDPLPPVLTQPQQMYPQNNMGYMNNGMGNYMHQGMGSMPMMGMQQSSMDTGRGINFDALVRANPTIGMGNMNQQMPMQNQINTGWGSRMPQQRAGW